MKAKKRIGRLFLAFGCLIVAAVILFPFYWLVICSLKNNRQLAEVPIHYWPTEPILSNYRDIFVLAPFLTYFKNSLIISMITVAISVLLCTLAAYAINRYKSRLTMAIALTFLVFSMFPNTAFVIPLYKSLKGLKLLNSNTGMIITYLTFTIPSMLWLLNVYFSTVPRDLEEAALIDGASRLKSLFLIVLPLAAPGVASAAILAFVRCWNEFFYAFIMLTKKIYKTLPVGINDYKQEYDLNWELLAAASVVAIIPVCIMIALFQKRIESGLTAGAIKS